MIEAIHIAAAPITLNKVTRQVCAWCGDTLFATELHGDVPTYPTGSYIGLIGTGGRALATNQIEWDKCCVKRTRPKLELVK